MLTCCFAECCGHIILHNAPKVFAVAYRLVKPLIDPKTATKILFVTDRDEDKMTELIGPDWRAITGAGQTRLDKCSPGYDHSVQWPITLENDRAWRERTGNTGPLSHEFTGYEEAPASPLQTALARSVVTPSPIKREEDPLEVEVLGGPLSPKACQGPESPLYDHAAWHACDRAHGAGPPRYWASRAASANGVPRPVDTPRRPAQNFCIIPTTKKTSAAAAAAAITTPSPRRAAPARERGRRSRRSARAEKKEPPRDLRPSCRSARSGGRTRGTRAWRCTAIPRASK